MSADRGTLWGMGGLSGAVSGWASALRVSAAGDPVELARVAVLEALAVRWARVVVARSTPERERVVASRELRAVLGAGARELVRRVPAGDPVGDGAGPGGDPVGAVLDSLGVPGGAAGGVIGPGRRA